MENKIYCILGLSGTGKSSVIEEIAKRENIKVVPPCTTRPKRENEIYGYDYYFLDNDVFDSLEKEGTIIGISKYKVANGDVWKYGFNSYRLKEKENVVIACNPKSFNELKNQGFNVISILIKVNDEERINRIYKRNDNQGLKEIIRRNKEDIEIYKNFKADKTIFNNGLLEDCVNEVENIIKSPKI